MSLTLAAGLLEDIPLVDFYRLDADRHQRCDLPGSPSFLYVLHDFLFPRRNLVGEFLIIDDIVHSSVAFIFGAELNSGEFFVVNAIQ